MATQGKVSDGKSKTFTAPVGGVIKGNFYRNSGWNHIAWETVAAGELYEGDIDPEAEFRVLIGAGVAAADGALLYIPSAGAGSADIVATATGNFPALKCMSAKDGSNYVTARVLNLPIMP